MEQKLHLSIPMGKRFWPSCKRRDYIAGDYAVRGRINLGLVVRGVHKGLDFRILNWSLSLIMGIVQSEIFNTNLYLN